MRNSTVVIFLICFLNQGFCQPIAKTMIKLPDTGQIKDFTNTFGEDSDYLINTPSYTNNHDGTITDNVTGLMWQQTDGGEMSIENARIYADTITLGGFKDWRLPSPLEAYSLLNHNNNNPAINREIFVNTNAQYWWTNTTQYNDPNKIWVTNAGGGIGNHLKTETISAGGTKSFNTRVVRDLKTANYLNERFVFNGEIVRDQLTALEWYVPGNGIPMDWEEALNYAESEVSADQSDWRLPNIKELQTLTDLGRSNPACNPAFFPSITTAKYWSSTSLSNQAGLAWHWDTKFGITSYSDKTQKLNIVLVRTAQIPSLSASIPEAKIVIQNPICHGLNFISTESTLHYILFDVSGNEVDRGHNLADKDFSNLMPGLYLIRLYNEHTDQTVKLCKL